MTKSKKPTPVKTPPITPSKKKPVKKMKAARATKTKSPKYIGEDHYWDWDEPFYEQY